MELNKIHRFKLFSKFLQIKILGSLICSRFFFISFVVDNRNSKLWVSVNHEVFDYLAGAFVDNYVQQLLTITYPLRHKDPLSLLPQKRLQVGRELLEYLALIKKLNKALYLVFSKVKNVFLVEAKIFDKKVQYQFGALFHELFSVNNLKTAFLDIISLVLRLL